MDNRLVNIIKDKTFVIPKYLFNNYKKLNITEEELVLLIYLLNMGDKFCYDPNFLMDELGIDKFRIMELVCSLCDKKIIEIKVEKDNFGKSVEVMYFDLFYNKVFLNLINLENNNIIVEDNSVYDVFEKEFGRTLSPMEYEIIKGWINDNIDNELILEALKEAVYNGVSNLRYIDKILYEWNKKNIKTKNDVIKDRNVYKSSKSSKKEVFDYNWLDDSE